MKVQYVGTADTRTIRAKDFERAGDTHPDATWQRGEAIDLPDQIGRGLIERLPKDFQEASADQEQTTAPTTFSPQGGDDEEGDEE